MDDYTIACYEEDRYQRKLQRNPVCIFCDEYIEGEPFWELEGPVCPYCWEARYGE